MVSASAEGMVIGEQLQHAAQLLNFEIDSNGQLLKRRGAVFAKPLATVTGYPHPISATETIIFSRVVTSTYADIVIDFFVRDTTLTDDAVSQYTAFFKLPNFELTQLFKKTITKSVGLLQPDSYFETVSA